MQYNSLISMIQLWFTTFTINVNCICCEKGKDKFTENFWSRGDSLNNLSGVIWTIWAYLRTLHCFTRFQRRKTTLMLCNRQFECKGIIKHKKNEIVKFVRLFWPGKEKGHLLNITWCCYTADHTDCLWNQNMAAQIPRSKVSDALQGFLWW